MQFAENEIVNLTEMIWQTSLGLQVQRVSKIPPESDAERTYLGCIHINGAWQGAVVLQCPTSLARKMTRIMFELGEQDPSADELEDTLSEVTNMTGGNIKSLLPGPCFLSMPAVVEGNDYRLRVPGTQLISQFVFRCSETHFVVSLLQKDDSRLAEAASASVRTTPFEEML